MSHHNHTLSLAHQYASENLQPRGALSLQFYKQWQFKKKRRKVHSIWRRSHALYALRIILQIHETRLTHSSWPRARPIEQRGLSIRPLPSDETVFKHLPKKKKIITTRPSKMLNKKASQTTWVDLKTVRRKSNLIVEFHVHIDKARRCEFSELLDCISSQ